MKLQIKLLALVALVTLSLLQNQLFAQTLLHATYNNSHGSTHVGEAGYQILPIDSSSLLSVGNFMSSSSNSDGAMIKWDLETGDTIGINIFGNPLAQTPKDACAKDSTIFIPYSEVNIDPLSSRFFTSEGVVHLFNSNNLNEITKTFFGSTGEDELEKIENINGFVVAAGQSNGADGDLPGNNGNFDIWVLGLEENGFTNFSRNYGGSGYEATGALHVGADSVIYIAGHTNSVDGDFFGNVIVGANDLFVMKLDKSGNVIWTNTFGGTSIESAKDIFVHNDTIYVSGTTSSDSLLGIEVPIERTNFLLTLDKNGAVDSIDFYANPITSIQSFNDDGLLLTTSNAGNGVLMYIDYDGITHIDQVELFSAVTDEFNAAYVHNDTIYAIGSRNPGVGGGENQLLAKFSSPDPDLPITNELLSIQCIEGKNQISVACPNCVTDRQMGGNAPTYQLECSKDNGYTWVAVSEPFKGPTLEYIEKSYVDGVDYYYYRLRDLNDLLDAPNATGAVQAAALNKCFNVASINVYPNPAKEYIHIGMNDFIGKDITNYSYTITSATGQIVQQGEATAETQISIDGLSAGLYVIRTFAKNSLTGGSQKFIKTN